MIRIDHADLQPVHMRRIRGSKIGCINELKIERAMIEIEAVRLESGLILGAAKMRHPQVIAIQVINAGHDWRALVRQILHDRRTVARDEIGRAHRAAIVAPTGPLIRAAPIADQRFDLA